MQLKKNLIAVLCMLSAVMLTLALSANALAAGPTESLLYTFQYFFDGAQPWGTLIADNAGNLYGTTTSGGVYSYGTVYELSPPNTPGGVWTQTTLYAFQNGDDGAQPYSNLIFDKRGNLYGTTNAGGAMPDCFECGTVFKLSKPATPGAPWTETVLYTFDGLDGAYPYAGLLMDEEGNLFGTTHTGGLSYQGAVFELSPPQNDSDGGTSSGAWKEKVLFSFTGGDDGSSPYGGLVRGEEGTLYGTTSLGGKAGFGAVFQLTPPHKRGAPWQESVLYSFTGGNDGASPYAGVLLGRNGELYGTATTGANPICDGGGCGTVFALNPPHTSGGAWSERTLYQFSGAADGAQPFGQLISDAKGHLYGTSSIGGYLTGSCSPNCGATFELTPPSSHQGVWTESTLHDFTGNGDGAYPIAGLLLTKNGTLYGTASSGGDPNLSVGVLFEVTP